MVCKVPLEPPPPELPPVHRPVPRLPKPRRGRAVRSVRRVVEVGRREPLRVCAGEHPVERRGVEVVGRHLQHVPDVHGERALDGLDEAPLAALEHLERGDAVLQQHGKQARVRVPLDAQVGAWVRARRVVVQPRERRVPALGESREVARGHPGVRLERAEQGLRERAARGEVCLAPRPEPRRRGRPLVEPVHVAGPLERAVLCAEVEALLPVPPLLGQLVVEPAPAVGRRPAHSLLRAAGLQEEVAHGAAEGAGEGGVHAVAGDVAEAPLLARAPQRCGGG
eukprot:CAMPEP_0183802626 /NCGR_PEP_ID=MMETSP0803_2-20130417/30844_1 /TAXON_ID=195967 /ORGANISM="Crustomastix stigmata, Strain CCMP3273" /LENGTH=280 /DNA_ID=CAMNT_0026047357 /DNA_START=220 /DNA_END=1058 /DNA_ORIENTATION=-